MRSIHWTIIAVIGLVCTFAVGFLFTPSNHITNKHTASPGVIMDIRDDSLSMVVPLWQTEVARRFPNAVVIFCHGGGIVKNEWVIQDNPNGEYGSKCEPVDKVLDDERAEYPDRTIVLLSCNPCHNVIHGHSNCFYADSSVWVVPDRYYNPGSDSPFNTMTIDMWNREDITTQLRSSVDPDVKGNIYEFISAE